MMQASFQIGDKAVHPSHGLGEVTAIERREIAGSAKAFYVLRIVDTEMRVMVPTGAEQNVGLRGVMSAPEAEQVLDVFRTKDRAVGGGPWNRRQRAYHDMMKTGSPYEVAKVLRDLYRIKVGDDKDLSFGERRILDQARGLLLKELAFARSTTEAKMEQEIEAIVAATA